MPKDNDELDNNNKKNLEVCHTADFQDFFRAIIFCVADKVIGSHKGSGDEQNQRISRTTRIKSGRTGAATGNRPFKRRKMGKRLQHTAIGSSFRAGENFSLLD